MPLLQRPCLSRTNEGSEPAWISTLWRNAGQCSRTMTTASRETEPPWFRRRRRAQCSSGGAGFSSSVAIENATLSPGWTPRAPMCSSCQATLTRLNADRLSPSITRSIRGGGRPCAHAVSHHVEVDRSVGGSGRDGLRVDDTVGAAVLASRDGIDTDPSRATNGDAPRSRPTTVPRPEWIARRIPVRAVASNCRVRTSRWKSSACAASSHCRTSGGGGLTVRHARQRTS